VASHKQRSDSCQRCGRCRVPGHRDAAVSNAARRASIPDLAGSTPATAPNSPVQRINNVSPLTGFWQSPASVRRRDSTGVCVEPTDIPANVYPLQFIAGPGTSINLNDSTFVCSWVQRWGRLHAANSNGANPQWGVSYRHRWRLSSMGTRDFRSNQCNRRPSHAYRSLDADGGQAQLLVNGMSPETSLHPRRLQPATRRW